MYKPLQTRLDMPIAQYEPVVCKNTVCKAILNPFCHFDVTSQTWTCRICGQRNALPLGYLNASPTNLPAEVRPTSTTIEYVVSRKTHGPPVFLYMIDTCQDPENLQALTDALVVSVSLLPRDVRIGIISFGTVVHVHEMSSSDCFKSVVFNGRKEYNPGIIQEALGFLSGDLRPAKGARPAPAMVRIAARYLVPVQEFELEITTVLEQLQLNAFKTQPHARQERCTGSALNIALSLLEAAAPNAASRMMVFTAGPCTIGPGVIVGPSLKEPIRSHGDIDNETASHYKKACKYYQMLSDRASKNGNVVDLFAGCYDQVGLDEMRSLPASTGGVLVLTDSFTTTIFKQTLIRMFNTDQEGYLEMGFLANLMVKTSQGLKVSGLLGHGISLGIKTCYVAETEVGLGGTSSWKMCGLHPSSSFAIFFDIVSTQPPTVLGGEASPHAFVQFATHYLHPSGTYRLRVTTVARTLLVPTQPQQLSLSFDQEAAAAVMARLALYKTETGLPVADVTRWIDRSLIKLCLRFAEYIKDDPQSFRLPPQFTYFPQFIYHLRRSQFLQVFNNSPDETIYYRHVFFHEDTTNSSIMIQPTLTAYEIDKDPEPVLLDSASVTADRILLLDTFFHILIYHGETVAAWRKAGYQDDVEYSNFNQLLDKPRQDAADLLVDRFPLPRFIDTEARGSQARFLFSRLNPSKSNAADAGYSAGGAVVLTDDVSLQDFMDYLIKLCVSSKKDREFK
jgi:protein transport protein SEC23